MGPAEEIRLLVVDDEESLLELCQDVLKEDGYCVDTAKNGSDALELIKGTDYSLALSDINMPVMGGLELLKEAKELRPRMEMILMTAFGGLESALEALRLGAYDYVTKPFRKDALLATVRRCLQKQRLTQELAAAQVKLIEKEKLAALGSLSAWLAHRMRNPLNVILMCSQYLKTRFDAADERQQVTLAIEEKVKILEHMTRDFIEFSRTQEPVKRPEDLNEVVSKALEKFSSTISVSRIDVERRLENALPPVPMDRDLMEEVLENILNNALEALSGPGKLRLFTRQNGNKAVLDVANTGHPPDSETLEKMFEPFFTTKDRGTGLGLAIVRKVVESHGGRVWASAAEGVTTVHLELPLSHEPA